MQDSKLKSLPDSEREWDEEAVAVGPEFVNDCSPACIALPETLTRAVTYTLSALSGFARHCLTPDESKLPDTTLALRVKKTN